MNVKKTKKFKENRPENYHVHDRGYQFHGIHFLQPSIVTKIPTQRLHGHHAAGSLLSLTLTLE